MSRAAAVAGVICTVATVATLEGGEVSKLKTAHAIVTPLVPLNAATHLQCANNSVRCE